MSNDFITAGIIASMWRLVIFVFFLGAATFAFLFFGIPWLWHLVKPWLHTITG